MKTSTFLTLCGAATLATSAHAATVIFTENFDGLSNGNLAGQGGWTGSTNAKVVADPGSFGFSGKIAENSVVADSNTGHAISGLNDTGIMTAEYDFRINGDNSYTYLSLSQSTVSFGVEYGNLTLRGADGGTQSFAHGFTGDNTYHITMTIDPTAYAGAGAATVNIAQYTAESTLGTSTTAFNNVQLNLDDPGQLLSDNTGINLRLARVASGRSIARADNIAITQVPEPSSAALLGLGGLALILRRRK